jgi:putative endonuclease
LEEKGNGASRVYLGVFVPIAIGIDSIDLWTPIVIGSKYSNIGLNLSLACVYVLYPEELKRFYTGSCLDLDLRLRDHLQRKYAGFTSKAEDWQLFLAIPDLKYDQARKIESHIKKMKSKTYIENLKKYSSMREKLLEKYKE